MAASQILTMDKIGWWVTTTLNGNRLGPRYNEDGFSVIDAYAPPRNLVDPSNSFSIADFGSYLTGYQPEISLGGRTFGASRISVDLNTGGGYFNITGKKFDGSIVSYFFASDNRPFQFENTILPSEFESGLVSLTASPLGIGSYQVSIDNVFLSPANFISGSSKNDVLLGQDGINEIYGYAGDDTLTGSDEDDILDGGTGIDIMTGGAGNDTYFVTTRNDMITEQSNEGIDTIVSGITYTLGANIENLKLIYGGDAHGTGNSLDNQIEGNSGANRLRGFLGNDTLLGKAGNDTLDGGWGKDILDGGAGYDAMTGGGNADVFRFTGSDLATGPAFGIVTDFSRAQGDLIDLRGLVAYSFIGSSAFTPFDEYGSSSEGEVRFDVSPAGIRLEGDLNGDSIADWFVELTGIHTLAAGDIIFG